MDIHKPRERRIRLKGSRMKNWGPKFALTAFLWSQFLSCRVLFPYEAHKTQNCQGHSFSLPSGRNFVPVFFLNSNYITPSKTKNNKSKGRIWNYTTSIANRDSFVTLHKAKHVDTTNTTYEEKVIIWDFINIISSPQNTLLKKWKHKSHTEISASYIPGKRSEDSICSWSLSCSLFAVPPG